LVFYVLILKVEGEICSTAKKPLNASKDMIARGIRKFVMSPRINSMPYDKRPSVLLTIVKRGKKKKKQNKKKKKKKREKPTKKKKKKKKKKKI